MKNLTIRASCLASLFSLASPALAQAGDSVATLIAPPSSDAGLSFVRVLGALALVIGLFLGGVWLFKNWQRLAVRRTRSLGNRHAVFVIGYEYERFLIASSPAGISLLSHLPAANEVETPTNENNPATLSFAQALAKALKGK
jgi:flagellar biogenesis protein FliO